jgi:hypothetical protein
MKAKNILDGITAAFLLFGGWYLSSGLSKFENFSNSFASIFFQTPNVSDVVFGSFLAGCGFGIVLSRILLSTIKKNPNSERSRQTGV